MKRIAGIDENKSRAQGKRTGTRSRAQENQGPQGKPEEAEEQTIFLAYQNGTEQSARATNAANEQRVPPIQSNVLILQASKRILGF